MTKEALDKIIEVCRIGAMSFDANAQWWNDFWQYLIGFGIISSFLIAIAMFLYFMYKIER